MTVNQEEKIKSVLTKMHYTEYRIGMWCKPFGDVLYCFDMTTMQIYWLKGPDSGGHEKIRCNFTPQKQMDSIREYESKRIFLMTT
jgi:hypothetical protein